MLDSMRELAELGVTHYHGSVPDVASITPLEILGERVIPVIAGM
jgi:alkanesulfonate monooxygenase